MRPHLSVVVVARNDDYGGHFLDRMQVFMNALGASSARWRLRAELVIVEWNPPRDKPRLRDVLNWPDCMKPDGIRVVEVPNEIHKRIPNSHRMPMFEYIAKNVGIKRAHGEYVLATNPDIVFSDRIMKSLASGNLRAGCFYRADRYDVKTRIPINMPFDKQLRLCARHAFLIHTMEGNVSAYRCARWMRAVVCNCRRLTPSRVVRGVIRRLGQSGGLRTELVKSERALPMVHRNTAGDFLLLAKQHWMELRGFPELATHSHIDSYMVYLLSYAGLSQEVLTGPIYHQEHDRSEHAERPLTVLEGVPAFAEMVATGKPVVTNNEDWGLGQTPLPGSGV